MIADDSDATQIPAAEAQPAYLPQLPTVDPNRPRVGKPLGFLIGFLILGGAINPVVTLFNLQKLLRLGAANHLLGLQLLSLDGLSSLMVLAGFSLLSSRRWGWRCAVTLLALVPALLAAVAILQKLQVPAPDWRTVASNLLQQSPFFAPACLAFLLSVPRLRKLYAGPAQVSGGKAALNAAKAPSDRPRGLFACWLGLLLLSLLVPPLWVVTRFTSVASSPSPAWDLRDSLLVPYLIEYLFAATCLALLVLLLLRRRWSSIGITITLLWAAPTLGLAWFVLARIGAIAIPADALYPAGLGFDWFAAMAWTAYLLEAPQVHRLYPGSRRYAELVTDVDVF